MNKFDELKSLAHSADEISALIRNTKRRRATSDYQNTCQKVRLARLGGALKRKEQAIRSLKKEFSKFLPPWDVPSSIQAAYVLAFPLGMLNEDPETLEHARSVLSEKQMALLLEKLSERHLDYKQR
jgi:hypothetical protein